MASFPSSTPEVKPPKPKVIPGRHVMVGFKKVKIRDEDLPYNGKVDLGSVEVIERGPDTEVRISATATAESGFEGRRFACFFTLKGKRIGYLDLDRDDYK
jgi:hypothetical protein